MDDTRDRGADPAMDVDTLTRIRGSDCVRRLVTLLRTVRSHGASNLVFQRQIPEFLENLESLFEAGGEALILTQQESILVNGVRLPERTLPVAVARALAAELSRVQLAGLCLMPGIDADQVTALVTRWSRATDEVGPDKLERQLLDAGVVTVNVLPFGRDLSGGGGSGSGAGSGAGAAGGGRAGGGDSQNSAATERALRVYEAAFRQTEGLMRQTQETGVPDLHAAIRVMQPVVDSILRHEYSIIGLTAIRKHDDYTYRHSLNVGLLAVAMGKALDLERRELAELGVTGLLHDLGKIDVPVEILQKPGRLAPEEWRLLQRHPLIGARSIARMPGLTRLMCDAMEVCLQHHRHRDGTGYPAATGMRQSAAGIIVAVADCFDALSAQRAYHEDPLTPYQALHYVAGQGGIRFDPGAVWALGAAVGPYPPGSVLQTASGYIVVVASPNHDQPDRPCCRVLRHPDGTSMTAGAPVLWSPMPPEERIARVLLAGEYPADPQTLLAA